MNFSPATLRRSQSAFTMVEIAICLAIIGIALVGIIGILPYGMNSQRDTREETVIDQDVNMLLPAITQGMRGVDDLTNYVYAITNFWTLYKPDGTPTGQSGTTGHTFSSASGGLPVNTPNTYPYYTLALLTNGANIIGLLSLPEYVANTNDYPAVPEAMNNGGGYEVYSNHVVAYVHSFSGLASGKPPQDNPLMLDDAFSYRVLVVNAPIALDTNTYNIPYNQQLWKNQHELRMTFLGPEQPNHTVGDMRLNFRATVPGLLSITNYNGQTLYFYQPQSFGVNTNI